MLSYLPYAVRRSTTAIVDGMVVVTHVDMGEVVGSLQPLGARESQHLPDAYRTTAKYKLYTRSTSLLLNGTLTNGTAALGDEIDTPLGRLRVVGVEQHYPSIVSPSLAAVAHGKYYLNGGDGVPNET